jgi:hypothetical protein
MAQHITKHPPIGAALALIVLSAALGAVSWAIVITRVVLRRKLKQLALDDWLMVVGLAPFTGMCVSAMMLAYSSANVMYIRFYYSSKMVSLIWASAMAFRSRLIVVCARANLLRRIHRANSLLARRCSPTLHADPTKITTHLVFDHLHNELGSNSCFCWVHHTSKTTSLLMGVALVGVANGDQPVRRTPNPVVLLHDGCCVHHPRLYDRRYASRNPVACASCPERQAFVGNTASTRSICFYGNHGRAHFHDEISGYAFPPSSGGQS